MEKKALRHFSMRAALLLALIFAFAGAQTAWATETSTITVGSTDYTLFTGFTATDGNGTNYAKLVDGNTSTDWRATKNYDDPNAPANDFAGGTADPAFVEFHADEAFIPKGYVLTCDHVNAGFWKPVQWALKARLNEGDAWTTIHSSNTTLGAGKTFEIPCSNGGDNEYQYFRFEVYEVGTTMIVDLDELQFYGSLPAYTHLTVKAATCMATGIKQDCYRRNSDGKYFTDNTGETELAESDVIAPIIPHAGVHHDATDVNIEYWQCSMCSKYFSNEGCTTEITEEQTKIYRTITIDNSISGLVEVAFSKTQALAGESIILYVDYQVDASTLKVNDGAVELTAKTDIQYTFTMPAADVTVTADVAQSNADGDVLTGSIRHTVTILDGASITLNDAAISGSIVCEGSATITLVGTNSVSGATNTAGIQIGGSGTTLTIRGDGSLTANGGAQSAGIGLSRAWNVTEDVVGGNIVINGGNITANGGGGGAGIGAGVTKDSNNSSSRKAIVGTITIAGGSVTAVGGSNADGIGAGENNYNATIQIGTVTIYDGIDKVDASSIKNFGSVVYMHGETNVTANKTDYFAIGEDGNRRLIVQKPVIADIPDQSYTGSEITPEPTVTIGSLTLTKSTDYTYSYENNTNVGTATVTVTFQGDYESLGSVEKEFSIVWSETDTDEYTIHNAAEWNVFCDCLQDNDTYNRFSGKTVKLGNDIGTAQDPITRMAGSQYHDFCGTFDGDGHTLTVNISSDDITDGSTQYVAPFRYVSNTKADPNDQADSPAAIRNLNVAGTITTAKQFAGGLIGGCWGNVSIENCAVSTAINSTIDGAGGHGGIVGIHSSGTLTITGCVFDGSLLGTTTHSVGGFIGYRKSGAEIRNSLFAPAEVTVQNDGSATFARNKVDTYNSYYTYYLCDGTNYKPYLDDGTVSPAKWNNGKAAHRITAGENVTIDGLGAGTEYNVSGITAYCTGIKYGSNLYAGSGDEVSLTLTNTATGAPEGYQYGYSASAGTLDGTTLTMPDGDVTITVGLAPIDWANVNQGTSADPYMIYNKDQLDLLAQRVNGGMVAYDKVIDDDGAYFYCYYSDKYFKLMNDITYSHTTDWFSNYNSTENNYEAIGCYYSYGKYRVFNGHFDGAGHTISGIRIYKGDSDDDVDSYQGIFGITNSDADIHDLTLADACITGYLSTGGIVGATGGTITRCHVANNVAINSVKDASGHGGIVGYNNGGTVSHCTSAVKLYHKLNSDYCLGGIAGGNDGTLTDNLVIGATIPTNNDKAYGAITGGHVGGTLEHNYYTACNVAGTPNAAGVGRCLFEHGIKFTIADATENDGAVPALRDGADNTYALSLFAAIPATLDLGWGAGKYSVQLTGRTLYKDGDWNTLCLPFAINSFAGTPLEGATVKELDATQSSLAGNTLTLKFNTATSIEAGKPYIIKWDGDGTNNVVNPVFQDVTITSTTPESVTSTDGKVTFVGQYSPFSIVESGATGDNQGNKNEILLMTKGNKIGYSKNPRTLNCFRCHFYVPTNGGQQAHSIDVDFGEGETTSLSEELRVKSEDVYYTLDGRKLEGKPTAKGMYIVNGRKVIIK